MERMISFDCINITREPYDLLLRKREAANFFKDEFEKEMARYFYVVRKAGPLMTK